MSVTTTPATNTFTVPGFCSGNAAASKQFYTRLFGWEAKEMTMDGGSYTSFRIGDGMVAGMYEMAADRKQAGIRPHWNTYLVVDDVEETAKAAERLGGKVKTPPFDAGGELMANLIDPLGAAFSVGQLRGQAETVRMCEIGAFCWGELYTTDSAKASEFYSKLLGWTAKPFEQSPVPYTVFSTPEMPYGIGGMAQITDDMAGMPVAWLPYFMVEDADATAKRVEELGGTVYGPFDVPTIGRIAVFQDTESAHFAVIKPMMTCGENCEG